MEESLNTSAVVAMLLTCGFIWGGFLLLLLYGIRRERQKAERGATG
jgi:hypothetical protein